MVTIVGFFKLKEYIMTGKNIKLDIYVITKPVHIIRPKSITGLIPLVYKVAKANIDVKAANRHGRYIFLNVM